MELNDCVVCNGFENSEIVTLAGTKKISELEWCFHPVSSGVEIKTLVEACESNDTFSSLLVRVRPGCELKEHIHDGQWEMHEVVAGYGESTLGDDRNDYEVGTVMVIPKKIKHSVKAGKNGLILLAKFF